MDSTSETLTDLFHRYSQVMDDIGECDGMIYEENQAKIDEIKAKIKGRKDAIQHWVMTTKRVIEIRGEMIEDAVREINDLEKKLETEEIKLMRWEELLEMAK